MRARKQADRADIIEEIAYHVRMICISFETRIVGIAIALAAVYAVRRFFGVPIDTKVPLIFALWLVTCLIYLAAIRKAGEHNSRRYIDNLHFTYYFPGIAYVTLLVHYLGGVEWVAFVLYIFDIVYGNSLMTRIRGAFVTVLIMVSFFTLGFLEYRGIVPHERSVLAYMNRHDDFSYFFTMSVIVGGGVFFIMSFLMGMFSQLREDREKTILDSKKRFEEKSRQLEKIAGSLRRKAAENKYIKRAVLGYVQNKESELEGAKKDLGQQIEKLRKTQRSMFMMIEDLNGMSSQLKDGRDHLEEKVRERTDELLNISKKLHRSERLAFLGKLAGSITHELRNPLAVLKNAAYYLNKKSTTCGENKIQKYIGIMKKEISAIDLIIEDVMGFARTKPPKFEKISVTKLVDNILASVNVPELIELEKDFADSPEIEIDAGQVTHALVNIVNNAIIAMKGNGTLGLRTYIEEDKVVIEISDSGPGIPEDQRDLIFEPLYSSRPKGTGLGLPIAKMMVENQKGSIDFTSVTGTGTTFMVRLPLSIKDRGRHG